MYLWCLVIFYCVLLGVSTSTRENTRPRHRHHHDIGRSCPQAPEALEDRRTNKNELSIATFNAGWLFGVADDTKWGTVKQTLSGLDADVVNMVEVEDCLVLARLASELPELRYKAYLLPGTDTATGQNVGLLTRVDPVIDLERTSNRNSALPSSRCYVARDLSAGHYDYQPTGLSKHYHTAIRLGGHLLHLYGVHLKADPNAPLACIQREGQALVLRDYILSHLRPSSPASTTSGSGIESHAAAFSGVTHQHVVVLGDLNDFDPSFAHDPTLSTPRSVVIPTLLALSPQTESDNLFNAAAKLRAVDRYSWEGALHGAPRHRSLLDHMLLSKDLYDRIVRVEIPHHDLPSARDASDHFPLLVKLDVSGF